MNTSNVAAKAQADAITVLVQAGTPPGLLKFYSGTPPTDTDTGLSGNTLLGTATMSATSFPAATDSNPGGLLTANAITSDSAADASGTCTFARLTNAAGTAIIQFTCGTSATDIIFNTNVFSVGGEIAMTSLTVKIPE